MSNLPNYANHHHLPGRRQLVYEAEAPRLAVGYSLAVVLAVLSPLWFRVVDPHLPQPQAAS